MSFKRHCGVQLQNEMYKKLSHINDDLEQGDVVATSSWKAENFKYTLHVAIINYNKSAQHKEKQPTLKTITMALQNIEQYLYHYEQHRNN